MGLESSGPTTKCKIYTNKMFPTWECRILLNKPNVGIMHFPIGNLKLCFPCGKLEFLKIPIKGVVPMWGF